MFRNWYLFLIVARLFKKVVYRIFLSTIHEPCFYYLQGNVKSHFMNSGKFWKYSFKRAFQEVEKCVIL